MNEAFEFPSEDHEYPEDSVEFFTNGKLHVATAWAGHGLPEPFAMRFGVQSVSFVKAEEHSSQVRIFVLRRNGIWTLEDKGFMAYEDEYVGIPAQAAIAMRQQLFEDFTASIGWDEVRMLLLRGINQRLRSFAYQLEEAMDWQQHGDPDRVHDVLHNIKAAVTAKAMLLEQPTEAESALALEMLGEFYKWDNPEYPDAGTLLDGAKGALADVKPKA